MREWHNMLTRVIEHGESRSDRTGVGTLSCFGHQERFSLWDGFPLVTTKHVRFDTVKKELLWFLSGSTNIRSLDARIWDEWADEEGNLGPIYGKQWRSWDGVSSSGEPRTVDQLAELCKGIKENPYSRRHIMTAWNVSQIEDMALPPCHLLCQFYVGNADTLSCHLYQRSADLFLGVPFNIASYALMLRLLAQHAGLKPNELVYSLGDMHLYKNHIGPAKKALARSPFKKPVLLLEEPDILGTHVLKNHPSPQGNQRALGAIQLKYYESAPSIPAKIAV